MLGSGTPGSRGGLSLCKAVTENRGAEPAGAAAVPTPVEGRRGYAAWSGRQPLAQVSFAAALTGGAAPEAAHLLDALRNVVVARTNPAKAGAVSIAAMIYSCIDPYCHRRIKTERPCMQAPAVAICHAFVQAKTLAKSTKSDQSWTLTPEQLGRVGKKSNQGSLS
jgi:hypothetical protein